MSYDYLVSKIAISKEKKKLGKIVRIENLPGKTIKKIVPHLMILVSKRFKKDIVVPIEAKYFVESTGTYAVIDYSKELFDEETKRLGITQYEREKYTGSLESDPARRRGNLLVHDYTGLGKKSKERRK